MSFVLIPGGSSYSRNPTKFGRVRKMDLPFPHQRFAYLSNARASLGYIRTCGGRFAFLPDQIWLSRVLNPHTYDAPPSGAHVGVSTRDRAGVPSFVLLNGPRTVGRSRPRACGTPPSSSTRRTTAARTAAPTGTWRCRAPTSPPLPPPLV